MGRTPRTTLIALVAAAAIAGCSGGSGGSGDDAATEVPPELEEAADQAVAVTDFCDAARANITTAEALRDFVGAGTPPRPGEEVQAVTEPMRDSNAQLVASAPEEARADAEAVAGLADMQLTVLEETDGDAAAAQQDPAYVEAATAADEATSRFRVYLRNRCGIDVD